MAVCRALVHGLLIDGTGAAPIPDSLVLTEGPRLAYAGSGSGMAVPAGAERIDATGKTVDRKSVV